METGTSSAEIADMTEIAEGLSPETGPQAAGILLGLAGPEGFAAALTVMLHGLAEWIGDQLHDDDTGGLISDMAVHAGALREAADQAAGEFERKHRLWLQGA